MQFKVGNDSLRNSETYIICQRKLLDEEILIKQSDLETANLQLSTLYNKVKVEVSFLDYGHVHTIITSGNKTSIGYIKISQNKKLEKLIIESKSQGTGKLIYNFTSLVLTDAQKSILSKGLDFAKYLNHRDFFLLFELLFRDIKASDNISDADIDYTKTKLKEISYTSLRYYNNKNHSFDNLSKAEVNALHELASLDNIVTQKLYES